MKETLNFKALLLTVLISTQAWGLGNENFSFLENNDDLILSRKNQETLVDYLKSLDNINQLLHVRSLEDKNERAFGYMTLALGLTLKGKEEEKLGIKQQVRYAGACELVYEIPEKSKKFFLFLNKNKISFMEGFTPLDIILFHKDNHADLIHDLLTEGATRGKSLKNSNPLYCLTWLLTNFQDYMTSRLR